MRPTEETSPEQCTEVTIDGRLLKPWHPPIQFVVAVDISEAEGASGSGSDGGASGFNAS